MNTVYGVAFSDNEFLMVYHSGRKGWEMPGGHIESGETPEVAVKREFIEEAGYNVEVVSTRELSNCYVCACKLLGKISENPEMKSELFSELPQELSFEREEYEDTVPWAKSVLY